MIHDQCKVADFSSLDSYFSLIKEQESEEKLDYLINVKNQLKYTPLHCAIFSRNIDGVNALLRYGADPNVKCYGFSPLHLSVFTANQPNGYEFGASCFKALLDNKSNIFTKDDHGFSILHWLSEFNLAELIELIFSIDGSLDLLNFSAKANGITALHRAALSNSVKACNILIQKGANLNCRSSLYGYSPLHFAAIHCCPDVWELLVTAGADLNLKDYFEMTPLDLLSPNGLQLSDQARNRLVPSNPASLKPTAIVTNPLCLKHFTCPPSDLETQSAPPENVKRLQVLTNELNGSLKSKDLTEFLDWHIIHKLAPLSDILRIHEWSYIRSIQAKCENIISEDPEDESGLGHLDGDTAISKETYNAALAAVGSVCHAVDLVVSGKAKNAFCPIRPPGHHAGPRGAVKSFPGGSESHGFCILNNISIGSSYAMNSYRDIIKKVAIIDFDVHHGNGTEETVRLLKPNIEEKSLANEFFFGNLFSPQYKPWFDENDSENVLFVSVHGYGPRERGLESLFPYSSFYPGSGETKIPNIDIVNKVEPGLNSEHIVTKNNFEQVSRLKEDESEDDDDDDDEDYDENNISNDDSSDSACVEEKTFTNHNFNSVESLKRLYQPQNYLNEDLESIRIRDPLILDVGINLPNFEFSDNQLGYGAKFINEFSYRSQWRSYFRDEIFPRLMKFTPDIIFISAGFDAHKKDLINSGYISLVEEDYEWVTNNLVSIANACCEGRIVSVLEGGYQLGGEYCSAFAQSAKSHVKSLASPNPKKFDSFLSAKEKSLEQDFLIRLEEARQKAILRKEQRLKEESVNNQEGVKEVKIENISSLGNNPELSDPNRKRKRSQVDYIALEKQLKEEKIID